MTDSIDNNGLKRRTLLQGTAGILATGIAPFVHAQRRSCCATSARR